MRAGRTRVIRRVAGTKVAGMRVGSICQGFRLFFGTNHYFIMASGLISLISALNSYA